MKIVYSFFFALMLLSQVSAQSPAGISNGLVGWFNANNLLETQADGDFIALWPDASPLANMASQSTPTLRPRLRKYGFNSHAALEFNGSSFLQFDLTDISGSPFTIFAVVKQQPVAASGKYFLGVEQTSPAGLHLGYATPEILRLGQSTTNANTASAPFDSAEETPRLVSARLHPAAGRTVSEIVDGMRRQGSLGNTSSPSFSALARIGRGHSSSGFPGFVAELIVYNRALTDGEMREVENYLAFKYGTTLPDAINTFFSSADYNHDVAAIGRFDDSALNQLTSKSENTDEILRITCATPLANEEYAAVGNNNASTDLAPSLAIQCGISAWMSRIWMVEKTSQPAALTLTFDLSQVACTPENVRLFIDANGNGFNDDVAIAGVYDEPYLVFTDIDLQSGNRFTLAQSEPTLYAVVSGNSSDAIWSSTPEGTPMQVNTWCGTSNVVIPSGITVQATAPLHVLDFTLASGGTFQSNAIELIVAGNFTNAGNFQAGTGRVQFAGTLAQQMNLTAATTFYQIEINTVDRVSISGGMASLGHVLSFSQGELVTNGLLTVLSTATRQGAIGPLTLGNLEGNIVMQRRAHRTNIGWMSLGNCIQGKTLNDWNDDLLFTGFPGSDVPAQGFNSVQTYIESTPGTTNQGFFGVTNVNQSISDKNGFFVYTSTGTLNIDVDGAIFKGDQLLPVSYTNTGNPSADGWSLVSNPYPCAIDWESAHWQKTNINNAVYVWNAPNAQHSSYVNGVSTNGGSALIASSQAFFVVANAAEPVLQISEEAKTTQTVAFRSSVCTDPLIRCTVSSLGGSDESVIRFNRSSTLGFDGDFDALKMKSLSAEVPALQTFDTSELGYSIQTVPLEESLVLPLCIQSPTKERVTFTTSGWEDLSEYDVYLEQISNGHLIPIKEHPTLLLPPSPLDKDAPNYRFILQRKSAIGLEKQGVQVFSAQGFLHIQQKESQRGTVSIFNQHGQLVMEHRVTQPNSQFALTLATGQYIAWLKSDDGSHYRQSFVHFQP